MKNKRKICVVITARPSYSRIKTTLQAIKKHSKLELQLIVAASALLDRYGSAINYIKKDGFTIDAKVFNILEGENLTSSAKSTGIGILEISTIFEKLAPDIVITVADRFETISTAIAASYMNIPLAHIQGGEVTGNIDEKVRHAITKLADYHFVSSKDAHKRVVKLGENSKYVYNTGCPSIDIAHQVKQKPKINFDFYKKYKGVGNKINIKESFIVVMQHPVTNEYELSYSQIIETLNAIKDLNYPTLWFWPNVDAGSDGTSKGIRWFRENKKIDNVYFLKNMEPTDFLNILNQSKCLIGNSSVGIRECAYLGVPVVNIGSRQNRRLRGDNVLDVNYCKNEINKAISQHLNKTRKPKSSNIYGRGNAGKQIAEILVDVPLIFHKTITF